MLKLFTKNDSIRSMTYMDYTFEYLRRSYFDEVNKIEDFYHNRVYAVKNQHLLVRLINLISIPFTYSYDRYTDVAINRSMYIAKNFKLAGTYNKGELFKGEFYGPDVNEVIFSLDDYFNVDHVRKNWKNVEAVKVFIHPKSNIDLLLPIDRKTSSETGLAVIGINIPLLALQYRMFIEDQMSKRSDGGILGTQHFVHMYVIPNMLRYQTALITLNRAKNLFYGSPMGESYFKHPFSIHHYEDKVDRVLNQQLKTISEKRLDFITALRMLPSLVHSNLYDTLLLPDFPSTIQGSWVYYLSRLNVIRFLIDLTGERSLSENREILKDLRLDTLYIKSTNILEKVLPVDALYDVQQDMDVIMNT